MNKFLDFRVRLVGKASNLRFVLEGLDSFLGFRYWVLIEELYINNNREAKEKEAIELMHAYQKLRRKNK